MGFNYHPLQETQLKYFHDVRRQLDARKAKTSSMAQRRAHLMREKANNYRHELDRLRGIHAQFNVNPLQLQHKPISDRINELKALGAKAVDTIQD
jgi:hypothetical protein